jgi:hypothetical protein
MALLADEYLKARWQAFAATTYAVADEVAFALYWDAFMAGADWERKYRGRRYDNEATSVTPYVDMKA